jgi:hypothetical protein
VIIDALQKGGVSLGDMITALTEQGLNPLSLQDVLEPGKASTIDAATKKKLQAAVASAAKKGGSSSANVVKALQAANVDPSVIAVLGATNCK